MVAAKLSILDDPTIDLSLLQDEHYWTEGHPCISQLNSLIRDQAFWKDQCNEVTPLHSIQSVHELCTMHYWNDVMKCDPHIFIQADHLLCNTLCKHDVILRSWVGVTVVFCLIAWMVDMEGTKVTCFWGGGHMLVPFYRRQLLIFGSLPYCTIDEISLSTAFRIENISFVIPLKIESDVPMMSRASTRLRTDHHPKTTGTSEGTRRMILKLVEIPFATGLYDGRRRRYFVGLKRWKILKQ